MNTKNILSKVDHTLLGVSATWQDIQAICDDAKKHQVASVCIPPSFVKQASAYLGGSCKVCTVIGFPNGYMTTATKVFEAKDALANGADEIDMVICIGDAKAGLFEKIESEIKQIKEAIGNHILKVIIEVCLLNEAEKIALCHAVTVAGADYIKTSTGFSTGGATREDIALFAKHIGKSVKIKAAGGIKTLDDANDFITLGAERLGTSSIIKIMNNMQVTGY